MRISEIATVTPSGPFTELPIRLEQRPARLSGLAGALFVATCAALLIAPLGLVAAAATERPATLLKIADQPLVAVQLGLALMAGTFLLLMSTRRIARRVGRDRTVLIETGRVTVFDRSLFGISLWSAPIREFRGLTHHMRASLSGTRHEIILVHHDRNRNILLDLAGRMSPERLNQIATLLELPEVPVRELYRSRRVLR